MTDRELMQMANRIEALAFEMKAPNNYTPRFVMLANEMRAALRVRLAQPEQAPKNNGRYLTGYKAQPEPEPVAWRYRIIPPSWTYSEEKPNREFAGSAWDRWQVQPLYTAPLQREWQGLTNEEVDAAAMMCVKSGQSVNTAIRAIEAKLREKNA